MSASCAVDGRQINSTSSTASPASPDTSTTTTSHTNPTTNAPSDLLGKEIFPGHGGLVVDINQNDVLKGRGGKINNHSGNVQFRDIVAKYRAAYKSQYTTKKSKMKIVNCIVQMIRNMNPPGRFLVEKRGGWVEVGDKEARRKTCQSIRETRAQLQKKIKKVDQEANSSGEEEKTPIIISQSQQQQNELGAYSTGNRFSNKRDLDTLLHHKSIEVNLHSVSTTIFSSSLPRKVIKGYGRSDCTNNGGKRKRFLSLKHEQTLLSLPQFENTNDFTPNYCL